MPFAFISTLEGGGRLHKLADGGKGGFGGSFSDVSGISEGLALLPKCGDAQKAAILKGLYATF